MINERERKRERFFKAFSKTCTPFEKYSPLKGGIESWLARIVTKNPVDERLKTTRGLGTSLHRNCRYSSGMSSPRRNPLCSRGSPRNRGRELEKEGDRGIESGCG